MTSESEMAVDQEGEATMTEEQQQMVAEFQTLMKNRETLMNAYVVEKCKVEGLVKNIQQLDARLQEITEIINGQ